MKARLITRYEQLQLLLCTGKILTFSDREAKEFLLSYDDPKHYAAGSKWDHDISMEDYRGETIAIVEDDGILSITDPEQFRHIMKSSETRYLTVSEFAEKHQKQPAIVRRMCQNGRIPGVFKGKSWMIPEDSPYPADARVGKRV